MYIGIDPGLSGAVAGINPDGFLWVKKVPIIKNSKGKTEYNVKAMMEIFEGEDITGAALELIHSMPGQGCTSMFRMGYGLGLWEGILAAMKIPYIKVSPQSWRKEILRDFVRGDDAKQASILNAERRFPKFNFKATERCTKIDDNMCDAANIALYAKLKFV